MGWGLIGSSVILLFLSVHCKRVKIPYSKHILLQGQKPNSLHSSPELSSLESLPDPLRVPILMASIHFLKESTTHFDSEPLQAAIPSDWKVPSSPIFT